MHTDKSTDKSLDKNICCVLAVLGTKPRASSHMPGTHCNLEWHPQSLWIKITEKCSSVLQKSQINLEKYIKERRAESQMMELWIGIYHINAETKSQKW